MIALALFFAPYPAAGIGIFAVVYAAKEFLRSADKRQFLAEEIFSVPNIVGVFWLLPLLVLYFMTNTEGMDKLWYVFDYTTPKRLVIFMILEFLLYAAILAPSYCRSVFLQLPSCRSALSLFSGLTNRTIFVCGLQFRLLSS